MYSLLASIFEVDSNYIQYDGHNEDQDIEHVERVFAYELYRQWCDHPIIRNDKNLVINVEIPKNLIDESRINDIPLMYPDMVLHYGQDNYKGNQIVCEIKREGYAKQYPDKVLDDFKKIYFYLDKQLKVKANNKNWEPFKIGVFILTKREDAIQPLSVNNIVELLGEKVREVKTFPEIIKKRIVCVVYNGKDLKYDTLYNMINII